MYLFWSFLNLRGRIEWREFENLGRTLLQQDCGTGILQKVGAPMILDTSLCAVWRRDEMDAAWSTGWSAAQCELFELWRIENRESWQARLTCCHDPRQVHFPRSVQETNLHFCTSQTVIWSCSTFEVCIVCIMFIEPGRCDSLLFT